MCNTKYDWSYTASSTQGCGSADGVCRICRGKMLGGTTSLNGLYYSRGSKYNYDAWEKDVGNSSWSYDAVLPYFLKSESNQYAEFLRGSGAKYHSATGPMKVSFLQNTTSSFQIFIDAAKENKVPSNPDFNAATEMGVGAFQFMAANGRRESTATAFLNPVKHRPNLYVMKNALATKIIINDKKVATGVEISINGTTYKATATKEIISSAGVIESPKLLLNSGIGPSADLKKLGIDVKQNLPVGENLFDHINTFIFFKAKNVTPVSRPTDAFDSIYNMAIHNTGSFVQTQAVASFQSTTGAKVANYEAIYFTFAKGSSDVGSLLALLGLGNETFQSVFEANKEHDILCVFFYYLLPLTRGTLKLKSKSPLDKPIIDMNYFDVEADRVNTVNAIKQQATLENTPTFKKHSAELINLNLKKCDSHKYRSDAYWKCYLGIVSASGMHQAGSCKMGPASSPKSVVDDQLRVIGIKNLRVIDSSM